VAFRLAASGAEVICSKFPLEEFCPNWYSAVEVFNHPYLLVGGYILKSVVCASPVGFGGRFHHSQLLFPKGLRGTAVN